MYIFKVIFTPKDAFSHAAKQAPLCHSSAIFSFLHLQSFWKYFWWYYFLIQITIVQGLFKSISLKKNNINISLFNILLTCPSVCSVPGPRLKGIIFNYQILCPYGRWYPVFHVLSTNTAFQEVLFYDPRILKAKLCYLAQSYSNFCLLQSLEERSLYFLPY